MDGRIYNTWLRLFEPGATKILKNLQRSICRKYYYQFLLSSFCYRYFTQRILSLIFECIQLREKSRCKGPAFLISEMEPDHLIARSLVTWLPTFPLLLRFWYFSLRQMGRCECVFAFFACNTKDYLYLKLNSRTRLKARSHLGGYKLHQRRSVAITVACFLFLPNKLLTRTSN